MPKHEANVGEERVRDCGRSEASEGGADAVRHERYDVRAAATEWEVDMVTMVEANGNKPISPLSVAAEPHCVSIKELQLGRRSINSPA